MSDGTSKILLLGNGINRAFGENSWNELIAEMASTSFDEKKQKLVEQLPYALQVVVWTQGDVGERIKLASEKLTTETISSERADLIKSLVSMPFDAILTTNYSYEIEKSINPSFTCSRGRACKYRKKSKKGNNADSQLGVNKYMKVDDNYPGIWHIHGEAALDKSMVIGHYYYGKLLSCIYDRVENIIKRYNSAIKNNEQFIPEDWIEYFLTSDVYIVGLGLDPSEYDLWWLINFKKIYADKLGNGKVYWFEPNMKETKNFSRLALAEANNIQIITKKVRKKQYKKYYNDLIKQIKKDFMY